MIFPLRIIIVFFLCFGSVGFAQKKLLKTIDHINTFEDANERVQMFEIQIQKIDTTKHTKEIGTLFHETGLSYYKAENYEKALSYLLKAVEVKKQLKDEISLNKSLLLIASTYLQLDEIEKAQKICSQIIRKSGKGKPTCSAYRMLAIIESNKGDFYKALGYLNEGLANKELCKKIEYENLLLGAVFSTYGQIYQEIELEKKEDKSDLNLIKQYQIKLEENHKIVSFKPENLAAIYVNLANVYASFHELNDALNLYTKAQKTYQENGDLYNELEVTLNIGIFYSKQKKHVLANQQYQHVINESDDDAQIASAYNSMVYFLNTKYAVEKLPFLEKAVIYGSYIKEQVKSNFRLPNLAEIKESENELDVLTYLIDLADYYVQAFNQTKETTYLHKAKETVFLTDQLVSLIRDNVNAEASKLFWIKEGVNTYMLAVKVCYLLDDVANAFYFMEKNKALLLQENIKTLQTKLVSNIPKTVLESEYKLHYELITLQEQFQKQIGSEEQKQKYGQKKKEYQSFMDSIKPLYPKYIKTKEKIDIVTLETVIKKYTTKNEAFVEYILHETDGYGIYYDGGNPVFFKIANVTEFQKQLESLRKFITKRQMNPKEQKEFQTIGHQAFQQLFPFENAAKRLKNKKLTIVADQTLQYIPFELLPTQTTGKLPESYLINTVETSYLQSFSLFEQIQQKQNAPTKNLLVIMPIEFKNKELPTLSEATKVFKSFEKDTTSLILQKEQATKENFLKYRNNFNIIHLNTHAGLDSVSQTPWVAFHDSNMTLTELFGLENQAELVILDACKTNDGVNLSGEGIINLSRGFFYNGTQSVLASQWKVNEQTGNEILQIFYKELEKGNSKSKALQLAKIAYIQEHKHTQNIPYYWAAFTLTGSTDAVMTPTYTGTIIIIGSIFVAISILFFLYRKKFSK